MLVSLHINIEQYQVCCLSTLNHLGLSLPNFSLRLPAPHSAILSVSSPLMSLNFLQNLPLCAFIIITFLPSVFYLLDIFYFFVCLFASYHFCQHYWDVGRCFFFTHTVTCKSFITLQWQFGGKIYWVCMFVFLFLLPSVCPSIWNFIDGWRNKRMGMICVARYYITHTNTRNTMS